MGWGCSSSRGPGACGRRPAGRSSRPMADGCGPAQPSSPPGVASLPTGRLAVASSHMVITEPVPDVLDAIGWTRGECITDSRAMVQYFRTTPDGRIAFGWGGGRVVAGGRVNGRAEVDARVAREVERRILRLFPALRGRRIE